MIGASDEQLDVFNAMWYNVLLNTGHASEGGITYLYASNLAFFTNNESLCFCSYKPD